MEKNIYAGRSSQVAPIQQSRRIYMAPQVMSVVSHEPIMAAAGSTDGAPGAKQQDITLSEELDSLDIWDE